MPTWSMLSTTWEPPQSKNTTAPGLGVVPQASWSMNHFAWSTV